MMPTNPPDAPAAEGVLETLDRRHHIPSPAIHFSPRERQVVQFVVDGCSNQEIADCMGLRPQTVKNHLSRIYRKLGISSRVQLAAYAVGYGLGQNG